MRIFKKSFVPTESAWATFIVIIILIVIFYIISRFLLETQKGIFSWG